MGNRVGKVVTHIINTERGEPGEYDPCKLKAGEKTKVGKKLQGERLVCHRKGTKELVRRRERHHKKKNKPQKIKSLLKGNIVKKR